MQKQFTILSFQREDLTGFLSQTHIERLTDEDLEKIASELREIYTLEMSLTTVLDFYAKFYLAFKK